MVQHTQITFVLVSLAAQCALALRLNPAPQLSAKVSHSISAQHAKEHILPGLSIRDVFFREWIEMTTQTPRFGQESSFTRTQHETSRAPMGNIAVLTSGTLKRYFLESAVRGLLAPMVSQGYNVDYFLYLNAGDFQSWKKRADRFQPDPTLGKKLVDVQQMITKTVLSVGAKLRHIDLVENVDLTEPMAQEFVTQASSWNHKTASAARSNLLKLFLQHRALKDAVERQEEQSGPYDWVIMVGDDALWIQPMNLSKLMGSDHGNHKQCAKANHAPHRAFNLHCSQKLSTWATDDCWQLITGFFVLDREAARTFMSQYNILLYGTHDGQIGNETANGKRYWSSSKQKLTNVEEFTKKIADENGIDVESVPARLIPMQRGGRVTTVNGQQSVCLHYVCDSASSTVERLKPLDAYARC